MIGSCKTRLHVPAIVSRVLVVVLIWPIGTIWHLIKSTFTIQLIMLKLKRHPPQPSPPASPIPNHRHLCRPTETILFFYTAMQAISLL